MWKRARNGFIQNFYHSVKLPDDKKCNCISLHFLPVVSVYSIDNILLKIKATPLTQWTWVWVNSGSWCWTGRPGVLRFMGSQRVRRDWATDLIWPLIFSFPIFIPHSEHGAWHKIFSKPSLNPKRNFQIYKP